jgi:cyclopropane fatty-acyl-phospholipid synthase-like methyltransferase
MKEITQKEYFSREENVRRYLNEYDKTDLNYLAIKDIKNSKVLSLGCGGGREVKLLVKNKNTVTAVDFSKKMIEQSYKVESRARYYWMNCLDYVIIDCEEYDYIIGMFNFLNGIEPERLEWFIEELYYCLNKGGQMIFNVRFINPTANSMAKMILAPALSPWLHRKYHFGDIVNDFSVYRYSFAHLFTKREIKKLFEGLKGDLEIKDTIIRFRRK